MYVLINTQQIQLGFPCIIYPCPDLSGGLPEPANLPSRDHSSL